MPYYDNFLHNTNLMFATRSVPQWGLGISLPLGATVRKVSTANGMAYLRGAKVHYYYLGRVGQLWLGLGRHVQVLQNGVSRRSSWSTRPQLVGLQSSTLNVPSREVPATPVYLWPLHHRHRRFCLPGSGPMFASFSLLLSTPARSPNEDRSQAWTDDFGPNGWEFDSLLSTPGVLIPSDHAGISFQ